MKSLLLVIAVFFIPSVYGTVSVQGEAMIVVEDYHTGGYGVQRVPTDYCIGTASEALAIAITQPVTIKSNYGCGHSSSMMLDTQVNAAICASISVEEVPSKDGSYNNTKVKIKKDLSKCKLKAKEASFVNALNQAIRKTYIMNGYQVVEIQ